MNDSKKLLVTYAKSLFQNFKETVSFEENNEKFFLGKIRIKKESKKKGDIFWLGEELLLIRSLIFSSKSMNQFFQNPTYSESQKLDILLTLFPGLSLPFQAFLKVLAERSHLTLLPQISEEYTKILLSFKNFTTVKIITASELKENYGLLLLNALKKVTNSKEILLEVSYDPRLLGGFILEYNSKSIDASVLKEFSLFFNET